MSGNPFRSYFAGGRVSWNRIISIGLILSIVMAVNSFALVSTHQTATPDEKIAKWKEDLNKRGVGEKSRWEEQLLDGRKVKGYASETGEDGVTLVDWKTKESSEIPFSEMRCLKPSRSTGAKIGITAAIVAGVTFGFLLILYAAAGGD